MNQGYNAQWENGASAKKNPPKRRSRGQRKAKAKATDAVEQDQQQRPSHGVSRPKSTRKRRPNVEPNVFLAVQVASVDIHDNVRAFQEILVERCPKYFHFRVPVPKCHVTLKVFNSPPEHIDTILQAMEKAVASNHKPIRLEFAGVSDFDDKVVFAQLTPNPALDALREKLIKAINHLNVLDHPLALDKYEPHLTLLKTSRCKDKKLRQMEIDLEHYEDMKHDYFGQELVGSVQLLSMNLRGERNGYYFSHGEVHFAEVFDGTIADPTTCCNEPFPKPSLEPESYLEPESCLEPESYLEKESISLWNDKATVKPSSVRTRVKGLCNRSLQMIFNPKTLIVVSLVALLTWKLRGNVNK